MEKTGIVSTQMNRGFFRYNIDLEYYRARNGMACKSVSAVVWRQAILWFLWLLRALKAVKRKKKVHHFWTRTGTSVVWFSRCFQQRFVILLNPQRFFQRLAFAWLPSNHLICEINIEMGKHVLRIMTNHGHFETDPARDSSASANSLCFAADVVSPSIVWLHWFLCDKDLA